MHIFDSFGPVWDHGKFQKRFLNIKKNSKKSKNSFLDVVRENYSIYFERCLQTENSSESE